MLASFHIRSLCFHFSFGQKAGLNPSTPQLHVVLLHQLHQILISFAPPRRGGGGCWVLHQLCSLAEFGKVVLAHVALLHAWLSLQSQPWLTQLLANLIWLTCGLLISTSSINLIPVCESDSMKIFLNPFAQASFISCIIAQISATVFACFPQFHVETTIPASASVYPKWIPISAQYKFLEDHFFTHKPTVCQLSIFSNTFRARLRTPLIYWG